jgi:hypothetical protein
LPLWKRRRSPESTASASASRSRENHGTSNNIKPLKSVSCCS